MNKEQFISYIKNPQMLDQHSVAGIKEILNDYPAFQTGHILLLKNLFSISDIRYDKTLAKVAAYAGNRELLYNFVIIGSKTTEDKAETHVVAPVPEVTTTDEPTTEPSLQMTPNQQPVEIEEETEEPHVQSEKSQTDNQIQVAGEEFTDEPPVLVVKKREYFELPSVSSDYFGNHSEVANAASEMASGIHSFTGWLDIMNSAHGTNISPQPEAVDQPSKGAWGIIENFIKEKPHFSVQEQNRMHVPVKNVDLSARSVTESEEFMTETLARIYLKQKNYSKAIQIFKKLSLKYPEKSIYFAGQIEYVQQLIHNEKQ
jgi:hypothetical protein